MPRKKGYVKAVIGGQWGDEGKGKIVDFLSEDADIVVRFNGGGNAGHTVENEHGDFKLRTVPVGVVNPRTKLNIIGSGTVPSLKLLVEELKVLEEKGVDFTSLRIDKAAHLVMPYHVIEDKLEEQARGKGSIGTTGSGIGPAYADKYRRIGFRAGELLDFRQFCDKFESVYSQKIRLFRRCYGYKKKLPNCSGLLLDIAYQLTYLRKHFGDLDKLICNTAPILWKAIDSGENILLEGAQGFLLDIDHGSYPYVTSSNTGVTAAAEGAGIDPRKITDVIGVFKAYTTRVGKGPHPTRASEEDERKLREIANEYGTVTGRPRNCGWFDVSLLKLAAQMNGFTAAAITRLDILDHFETLWIGNRMCNLSHALGSLVAGSGATSVSPTPVMEYMTGWGPEESVKNCRSWDELPQRAKKYLEKIACGVPIKYVSVGSRREETIVV